MSIEAALSELKKIAVEDYRRQQERWMVQATLKNPDEEKRYREHYESSVANYESQFRFAFGRKYVRIESLGGAYGFVVNTHEDPKFPYGALLKCAGWKTPARNFERGNVFYLDPAEIDWASIR